MSKAVLSENDAHFAGVFDGKASSDAVQDLVRKSDFILALGVWLTDINTLGWPPDLDKTAFVSLDTVKFGTYFGAQVSLEAFHRRLGGPQACHAKVRLSRKNRTAQCSMRQI